MKLKKLTFGGKPIPKEVYRDNDKDGYPNYLDCKPNNPNKQGWLGDKAKAAFGFVGKKQEQYRDWKGKREERQTEEYERKSKLEGAKYTYEKKRAATAKVKYGAMSARNKAMGSMPSMFGGSMGGGSSKSDVDPFSINPFSMGSSSPTRRKKKRKKKSKGKSITIQLS